MNQSTASPSPGQITRAPFVQLVDIDGFAVPDCERHTPTCNRPPCPADSWPAWTDLMTVELGPGRYPKVHDIDRGLDLLVEMFFDFVAYLEGDEPDPDDPLDSRGDPENHPPGWPTWYCMPPTRPFAHQPPPRPIGSEASAIDPEDLDTAEFPAPALGFMGGSRRVALARLIQRGKLRDLGPDPAPAQAWADQVIEAFDPDNPSVPY